MMEDFMEEGWQDVIKSIWNVNVYRSTLPTTVNPEFPEFEIWESSDNFQTDIDLALIKYFLMKLSGSLSKVLKF